ncbi:MAG: hypothetical protein IPP94_14920 [Ignavibacteria bacterium]|nr:hypothetical protein [Ignavibacteria bacterium]
MIKVILLIACLFANTAIAQVLVTLRQPPPNQLGATDIWNLTVTNQSPAEVELYLEGTVDEAQDGRIVEGTCGAFKLKANETKTSPRTTFRAAESTIGGTGNIRK